VFINRLYEADFYKLYWKLMLFPLLILKNKLIAVIYNIKIILINLHASQNALWPSVNSIIPNSNKCTIAKDQVDSF